MSNSSYTYRFYNDIVWRFATCHPDIWAKVCPVTFETNTFAIFSPKKNNFVRAPAAAKHRALKEGMKFVIRSAQIVKERTGTFTDNGFTSHAACDCHAFEKVLATRYSKLNQ